jgi:hypothetical protein
MPNTALESPPTPALVKGVVSAAAISQTCAEGGASEAVWLWLGENSWSNIGYGGLSDSAGTFGHPMELTCPKGESFLMSEEALGTSLAWCQSSRAMRDLCGRTLLGGLLFLSASRRPLASEPARCSPCQTPDTHVVTGGSGFTLVTAATWGAATGGCGQRDGATSRAARMQGQCLVAGAVR